MTSQSDETKIAVLGQRFDDLRDDVREVKNMLSDKIATKEYVDDRVNPIKKLLYVGVAGFVTLTVGLVIAMIGLLANK